MACIYIIHNREVPGAAYVGSTVNTHLDRWRRHKTNLKRRVHINPKLQNVWNKYGESALVVEVLEEVSNPADLLVREQFYLDWRKASFPERLNYNLAWTAGNTLGRKLSAQSIQKRLESFARNRGRTYRFRSPQGVDFETKNYSQFARDHGLNFGNLSSLLSGDTCTVKGWTCPDVVPKKAQIPGRNYLRSWSFRSPDGEVYETKNIRKFAEENDLTKEALSKVWRGRYAHHKGWTKV